MDPSSPAPEVDLPSTPILISDDPTMRTPEWIPTPLTTPKLQFSDKEEGRLTTPPGTPVLHLDDEKQDRDE